MFCSWRWPEASPTAQHLRPWGKHASTGPAAGPGCEQGRCQWAGAEPGAPLPAAGSAVPPLAALSAPAALLPGPQVRAPLCSAPATCAGCSLAADRTRGSAWWSGSAVVAAGSPQVQPQGPGCLQLKAQAQAQPWWLRSPQEGVDGGQGHWPGMGGPGAYP